MKYPQMVVDMAGLEWLAPDLERLGVDADQSVCVARLLVSTLRCTIHSTDVLELNALKSAIRAVNKSDASAIAANDTATAPGTCGLAAAAAAAPVGGAPDGRLSLKLQLKLFEDFGVWDELKCMHTLMELLKALGLEPATVAHDQLLDCVGLVRRLFEHIERSERDELLTNGATLAATSASSPSSTSTNADRASTLSSRSSPTSSSSASASSTSASPFSVAAAAVAAEQSPTMRLATAAQIAAGLYFSAFPSLSGGDKQAAASPTALPTLPSPPPPSNPFRRPRNGALKVTIGAEPPHKAKQQMQPPVRLNQRRADTTKGRNGGGQTTSNASGSSGDVRRNGGGGGNNGGKKNNNNNNKQLGNADGRKPKKSLAKANGPMRHNPTGANNKPRRSPSTSSTGSRSPPPGPAVTGAGRQPAPPLLVKHTLRPINCRAAALQRPQQLPLRAAYRFQPQPQQPPAAPTAHQSRRTRRNVRAFLHQHPHPTLPVSPVSLPVLLLMSAPPPADQIMMPAPPPPPPSSPPPARSPLPEAPVPALVREARAAFAARRSYHQERRDREAERLALAADAAAGTDSETELQLRLQPRPLYLRDGTPDDTGAGARQLLERRLHAEQELQRRQLAAQRLIEQRRQQQQQQLLAVPVDPTAPAIDAAAVALERRTNATSDQRLRLYEREGTPADTPPQTASLPVMRSVAPAEHIDIDRELSELVATEPDAHELVPPPPSGSHMSFEFFWEHYNRHLYSEDQQQQQQQQQQAEQLVQQLERHYSRRQPASQFRQLPYEQLEQLQQHLSPVTYRTAGQPMAAPQLYVEPVQPYDMLSLEAQQRRLAAAQAPIYPQPHEGWSPQLGPDMAGYREIYHPAGPVAEFYPDHRQHQQQQHPQQAPPPPPLRRRTPDAAHVPPTDQQLLDVQRASVGMCQSTTAAAVAAWTVNQPAELQQRHHQLQQQQQLERLAAEHRLQLQRHFIRNTLQQMPPAVAHHPQPHPTLFNYGRLGAAPALQPPPPPPPMPLVPQTLANHAPDGRSGFVRMTIGNGAAWRSSPAALVAAADARAYQLAAVAAARDAADLSRRQQLEGQQQRGGLAAAVAASAAQSSVQQQQQQPPAPPAHPHQQAGGIPLLEHTHFSPLKGVYFDGTTFPIDSRLPHVSYRRPSPDGRTRLLPDGSRLLPFVPPNGADDESLTDASSTATDQLRPLTDADGAVGGTDDPFIVTFRMRSTRDDKACQTSFSPVALGERRPVVGRLGLDFADADENDAEVAAAVGAGCILTSAVNATAAARAAAAAAAADCLNDEQMRQDVDRLLLDNDEPAAAEASQAAGANAYATEAVEGAGAPAAAGHHQHQLQYSNVGEQQQQQRSAPAQWRLPDGRAAAAAVSTVSADHSWCPSAVHQLWQSCGDGTEGNGDVVDACAVRMAHLGAMHMSDGVVSADEQEKRAQSAAAAAAANGGLDVAQLELRPVYQDDDGASAAAEMGQWSADEGDAYAAAAAIEPNGGLAPMGGWQHFLNQVLNGMPASEAEMIVNLVANVLPFPADGYDEGADDEHDDDGGEQAAEEAEVAHEEAVYQPAPEDDDDDDEDDEDDIDDGLGSSASDEADNDDEDGLNWNGRRLVHAIDGDGDGGGEEDDEDDGDDDADDDEGAAGGTDGNGENEPVDGDAELEEEDELDEDSEHSGYEGTSDDAEVAEEQGDGVDADEANEEIVVGFDTDADVEDSNDDDTHSSSGDSAADVRIDGGHADGNVTGEPAWPPTGVDVRSVADKLQQQNLYRQELQQLQTLPMTSGFFQMLSTMMNGQQNQQQPAAALAPPADNRTTAIVQMPGGSLAAGVATGGGGGCRSRSSGHSGATAAAGCSGCSGRPAPAAGDSGMGPVQCAHCLRFYEASASAAAASAMCAKCRQRRQRIRVVATVLVRSVDRAPAVDGAARPDPGGGSDSSGSGSGSGSSSSDEYVSVGSASPTLTAECASDSGGSSGRTPQTVEGTAAAVAAERDDRHIIPPVEPKRMGDDDFCWSNGKPTSATATAHQSIM